MMRHRHVSAIVSVLCLFGLVVLGPGSPLAVGRLPKQLSDRAFWQMIVDFSEPGGTFRSDNFVSNEKTYQEIIPELKKRSSPDGAYLGVGPDQNFTYIAALRPRIAFIIDIRRQNLIHHLLYKALIEMSGDRAEFLSRLFSRPRAAGLEKSATPDALFRSFESAQASEPTFQTNLGEVENRLMKRHGFPLTVEDQKTLEYIYRAFYAEGPGLRYSFPRQRSAPWFPSYAELMQATDLTGLNHGYLATEENYRVLREFERNNLLVPIVGDFAGDKAIRAVGRYLADHGATANYFYTSNVEQYLFQGDAYQHYYSSVGALPLNEKSTFIRSYFNMGFRYPPGIVTPDLHSVQLLDPILGFLRAFRAGQIHTYDDVVDRPK
jgi:hypothetical protein